MGRKQEDNLPFETLSGFSLAKRGSDNYTKTRRCLQGVRVGVFIKDLVPREPAGARPKRSKRIHSCGSVVWSETHEPQVPSNHL